VINAALQIAFYDHNTTSTTNPKPKKPLPLKPSPKSKKPTPPPLKKYKPSSPPKPSTNPKPASSRFVLRQARNEDMTVVRRARSRQNPRDCSSCAIELAMNDKPLMITLLQQC